MLHFLQTGSYLVCLVMKRRHRYVTRSITWKQRLIRAETINNAVLLKRKYTKKDQLKFVRKRKNERMISSHVLLTSPDKPTMMDYTSNLCAVLASFYVGTGGLDILLINVCQGISGGKNWEQTFARHSPAVCASILKVVDACFKENLEE